MSPKSKGWSKYNTKSLKYPKGRKGSEYYNHLLKTFGEEQADKYYSKFYYQSTGNGFRPIKLNTPQ